MTEPPRRHLAERAMQALGGLNVPAPAPVSGAPPRADQQALPDALRAGAGVMDVPRPQEARPGLPPGGAPTSPPIPLVRLHAAGMIAHAHARNRLFEEIAVVQDQVVRTVHATAATGGRHPRLVAVTSTLPGEGKTFMALNIAAAMAAARAQPVMLLDADGKSGSLSELLDCKDRPGIAELAANPDRPVGPNVVPTERDRLFVLPFGQGRPSGAAIASAALRVAETHPRHIVILDLPPALSTSEASALAPVVGQVVMVVEAERTQRGQIEAALDLLDGCPTVQLVLNRARPGDERFGAYGYDG
ncbi:P-loop NTPase family protein [Sabulicella glaciei]|uniref:Uncharacterized protein n=1 Tax=Sabulicella glaciei TaxID=2984948 RepID=A0ABT3NRL9_9PROT|nr:hypothetical protein [Roseococcus sp. MDT2-1-1]MCW8084809.1 hypothetical protein [Roseococcus sp. MDT2-1-1]